MSTVSEKPASPGKRKSASGAKAAAAAADSVTEAIAAAAESTQETAAQETAAQETAAQEAATQEAAAEPLADAAPQAPSPEPPEAPSEIVAPAAAPSYPKADLTTDSKKTDSKPSHPLTFMVSHMTATPTFKGYDEIAAFGKANIDAFIQANTIFTKGVEAISKEMIALTQAQLEAAAAAAKAIFAAKTLKDVVELNAEFTKANFDKLVANSTKLGEMGTKVATDAFAPLSARVTSVVEQAAKPAA